MDKAQMVLDSMIRELKPVFRPGFVGDNPVWACGRLRDDYEALQAEVHSLKAAAEDRDETIEALHGDIETLCDVTQAHLSSILRWLAVPDAPTTDDLVRMAIEMESVIDTARGA